jgi:hypothetical protein
MPRRGSCGARSCRITNTAFPSAQYTFGSIFSNVVNPRFGSGRGDGFGGMGGGFGDH